jgi:hypothetical protein
MLYYRDQISNSHSSNSCPGEGTMAVYTLLIYKRKLKGLMNSHNICGQFFMHIHYLELIIYNELWGCV